MFWKKKKSSLEEWKACFMEVLHNQSKPMGQVTYWTLFLASGFTFVFGVVMGAADGSYDLILQNPDIAASSWLASGFLVF